MDIFEVEQINKCEMPVKFEWHIKKYFLLDNDYRDKCKKVFTDLKEYGYDIRFIKASEKEDVNRYVCKKVGRK